MRVFYGLCAVLVGCGGVSAATETLPVPETTTTLSTTTLPETTTTTPVPELVIDVKTPAVRRPQIQVTETLPPPYVWEGPIPVVSGGIGCSVLEATIITKKFADAGASYDTQVWSLKVASRESGCDNSQHNYNTTTRDDSYGWCQLNARAGHFGSNGVLADFDRHTLLTNFEYNTDACVTMWKSCGRGPWNYGNYYCKEPTS